MEPTEPVDFRITVDTRPLSEADLRDLARVHLECSRLERISPGLKAWHLALARALHAEGRRRDDVMAVFEFELDNADIEAGGLVSEMDPAELVDRAPGDEPGHGVSP